MINNEFILNVNSKDLSQKSSKVINDKTTINNKAIVDNNFKKILNEKSKNTTNNDNQIKNRSSNEKITKSNEVKVLDDSNFEKAIKEIVEVISNEENFQGNKLEDGILEEVVALLNQILNSPKFENLLPIKLEDPMFISNSNKSLNIEEISLLNSIDINPDIEIKNDNFNKEALNLINTILETLNSKNINEVIPSGNVNAFKSALELLSENLLNNTSVLTEVVDEQSLGIKELKAIEENSEMEKSNSSEEISKYGATSETKTEEVETEEDKVLAKILGESENGSLSKQSAFMSRLNAKSPDVIKEPMVVSKETMDADIIKNVKFMMKNAVAELKVKIYPKELGEMTIKLLSEEGILKADIRATSKETYNLLHSNLSDIKKSLEQQNIKIYEVNIGLYSEDTTYFSGEESNNETFKNNENGQGRNSSRESVFLTDDSEGDENLYDDSSVNLLV